MFITLNGKKREVKEEISLPVLLAEFKVPEKGIAVEVNGNIIPHSDFSNLEIRKGDTIEILRIIGGG
jgi:thiamine biosynthesis protein ThiS